MWIMLPVLWSIDIVLSFDECYVDYFWGVVIYVITLYSMMCVQIQTKIATLIEKKMRKLFWNGNQDQDKILLLAWDKIC